MKLFTFTFEIVLADRETVADILALNLDSAIAALRERFPNLLAWYL